MSKTDNDMIPRLALCVAMFVAMTSAPRLIEWWNKRKEKTSVAKTKWNFGRSNPRILNLLRVAMN